MQGAALETRARSHRHRPQPRPPGPPHRQGRAGPRLDRVPRSRPDRPAPPNPNHQGTQDNRGRLRDQLAGHDRRATGHHRHLDPGTLGHRIAALGPRRYIRRRSPPAAHRPRTTGHGHPPQHGHQPPPPGRIHQNRHSPTTSRATHKQTYRTSPRRMNDFAEPLVTPALTLEKLVMMLSSSIRPSFRRSAGTRAMPRRTAWVGLVGAGVPSGSVIAPAVGLASPTIVFIIRRPP